MSAIEGCRTAALGGHVARCENDACGHTAIAYNSCRNRHCPKCQGAKPEDWMEARKAELLEVPYFHVVFTLPARIGAIAYQNKAVIYDLLFKASAETLLTIAADPKRLGVRIGFTSVLHTWGSAMTHHPHVHMIVPGGGISLMHRGGSASEDYLLPVPVLSHLFRGKMLAMLKAAHEAGRLQFFGRHAALADKAAFKSWLKPLYDTKWHVHAKRPFAGPEAVLGYLARYTHRVAISNSRLIAADEFGVTFKLQGLSHRGPRPLQDDDAGAGRVHPPVHAARPAEGLPSHPALRPARQRSGQGRDHRAGPRADRCSDTSAEAAGRRQHSDDRETGASLPVLRRAHGDHRDVRGRPHAASSADHDAGRDQDRHVMMVLATVLPVTAVSFFSWFTAGDDDARPDRPSVAWQGPRTTLQDCGLDAGLASDRVSVLIRCRAASFTRPTLPHRRQPNPHRAR